MSCVDPARRFSERQELLQQVVAGFRVHTLVLRRQCRLVALHAAIVA